MDDRVLRIAVLLAAHIIFLSAGALRILRGQRRHMLRSRGPWYLQYYPPLVWVPFLFAYFFPLPFDLPMAVRLVGLAIEVGLIGGDALAPQLDLLAEARKRALEVVEIGLDARQPRLGLLRRQAVGHRVDREQLVARRQQLALGDGDAHDLARHLRRDQHLLGADVGIVGGHIAPAHEIEIEPDGGGERGDDQHQRRAQRRGPHRQRGRRSQLRERASRHCW